MKSGYRLSGVRQVFSEGGKEPAVLGHGQWSRLDHVHSMVGSRTCDRLAERPHYIGARTRLWKKKYKSQIKKKCQKLKYMRKEHDMKLSHLWATVRNF